MAHIAEVLGSQATFYITLLLCYISLCRALRYRRRDRMLASYPYKTREDLSNMTAKHAWEISRDIWSLEFPLIATKATKFALFRTYGIPTISSLLYSTQQLSSRLHAPRREVDTGILISEFLTYSPTSFRGCSAIARMNYLHSLYQRAGKISNDDMLYTLSLFVLEAQRWIGMYEWSTLTEVEVCAMGTQWKSIGDAMGITWEALAHGPASFQNGIQFVEDLRKWSAAYEEWAMVPNEWSHKLAEETIAILLSDVPDFMKPVGRNIVFALLDERLRRAMMFPDPPRFYIHALKYTLAFRKYFLRYLALPRPSFFRLNFLSSSPDPKTGRYQYKIGRSEPWYVKPTFLARYSPTTLLRRILGRPYPDGKNFKPEGYLHLELGPKNLEKSGRGECEMTRDRLLGEEGRGGCPFAAGRG